MWLPEPVDIGQHSVTTTTAGNSRKAPAGIADIAFGKTRELSRKTNRRNGYGFSQFDFYTD